MLGASCLLCSLLCVGHLHGQVSISNSYLQVTMATDTGNLTIATTGGDPTNPADDNLPLNAPAATAFVLRLYNVLTSPSLGASNVDIDLRATGTVGLVTVTVQSQGAVGSTLFREWLIFVPDPITGLLPTTPTLRVVRECTLLGDALELRLRVENRSSITRDIGIGMIWVRGFGGPYAVSTSSVPITGEREVTAYAAMPEAWFALQAPAAVLSVKGTVRPTDGPLPDRLLFANIANLNALTGYGFDYTTLSPFDSVTGAGTGAVGLYWNRLSVPPGRAVTVTTSIGLNLAYGDYRRPFSLRVLPIPPFELQLGDNPLTPEVETAYPTPNPFSVTALVANGDTASAPTTTVTLALPDGLRFAPGETGTKVIPSVPSGGERQVSWQVQIDPGVSGPKEVTVLATNAQGTRQVRLTLLIPAPPTMSLKGGVNLVGFPFLFVNPEPSAALGIPSGSLQLAHYDPRVGDYLIYGRDAAFTRLEPGLGYWLRLPSVQTITLNGVQVPRQDITVPLRRGWNQLANPFPWPILLRGVLEPLVAQGIVRPVMFVWNVDPAIPPYGGEYVALFGTDVQLKPWQGFWLFSEADSTITFGAPSFSGTWRTRQASLSVTATEPSVPNGWAVRWIARSAAGRDAATWIGVSPRAHDGYDALDVPKPPPVPNGLQVRSVVAAGRSAIPLSVDVRPTNSRVAWTLEVVNPAGGEVTLQVENLSSVPRSVHLVLVDPETGQRWALRTTPVVQVLTDARRPKRLQVLAVASNQVPLRVQGLRVVPLRGQGARIEFSVPQPCRVRVQVRSLTGRTIWEAYLNALPGGRQSILWDGRGAHGQPLPLSAYMVVVQAVAEDGRSVQAQTLVR